MSLTLPRHAEAQCVAEKAPQSLHWEEVRFYVGHGMAQSVYGMQRARAALKTSGLLDLSSAKKIATRGLFCCFYTSDSGRSVYGSHLLAPLSAAAAVVAAGFRPTGAQD